MGNSRSTDPIARRGPRWQTLAQLGSVLLGGACGESMAPVEREEEQRPNAVVAALACEASPANGNVRCTSDQSVLAGSRHGFAAVPAIIGGHGQFVNLVPGNGNYNASQGTFSFPMRVQNLLAQTMGTPDGSTITAVRVFFVGSITNNVALDNPDGTGTFTDVGQPFFTYNQAIDRDEASTPRTWVFENIPPANPQFSFGILIQAELSDRIIDAQYCAGDVKRRVDVFYPDDESFPPPRPLIVYVHGGAWTDGDKSDDNEHVLYDPVKDELLARGYVFAAVNYRLAGGGANSWPAPVEDVKCAVRHLRHDALKYRIDPDRIGAWGHSTGGYLASMLGVLEQGQFEGNAGYATTSSEVQAVVPQAAITDLTEPTELFGFDAELEAAFPGYSAQASITITASPVTYADLSDPPFLKLHGDADPTVNQLQSIRLHGLLGGTVNGHDLEIVEGASHSFFIPGVGTPPGLAELVADFFDAQLGN